MEKMDSLFTCSGTGPPPHREGGSFASRSSAFGLESADKRGAVGGGGGKERAGAVASTP
jgi:hypothetical protein